MKFKYKGEMREALVHVPSTRPGHKTRVILNYHGLGCNGPQQAKYTGMAKLGTREGFIVVHPTAKKGPIGMRMWDGINSRLVNTFEKNDDAGFTRALLDKLEQQIRSETGLNVPVDRDVVFATGFSNGAFLTPSWPVACRRSRPSHRCRASSPPRERPTDRSRSCHRRITRWRCTRCTAPQIPWCSTVGVRAS